MHFASLTLVGESMEQPHRYLKENLVNGCNLIEAAVGARGDADLVIIARTGGVKNESFERALERLHAYRAAGADMLMLMPETDEQITATRAELDAPLATITAMDQCAQTKWKDSGWIFGYSFNW